jgi:hypothetical protein
MRGLRFLTRFSFICSLLFVVCLCIKAFYHTDATENVGMIGGTVIVLGYFVSPVMNLAMSIWFASLLLSKKQIPVKNWLIIATFLFLILQFIVFFILPA